MIVNCTVTNISTLTSYGYVTVKVPISGNTTRAYVPPVLATSIAVNDTLIVDLWPAYQVQVLAGGWGSVTSSSVRSVVTTYLPTLFVPTSASIAMAISGGTQLVVAQGLSKVDATSVKTALVQVGCIASKISILEIASYIAINKAATAPKYLTSYLTQEAALDNYLLQQDAADKYATKTSIPTKTSQLTNDSDFVTSTAVANNYLNKTTAAATYATRSDVEATYLKQSDASSTYLTQEAALDNYLLQQDATDKYATKTSIPTNVSQLTNDSDFITSTALSPYLKTADAASTYITKTDAASTYATKTSIPTKVSQLTNDAGFITGTYIASNYYNMVQVDTKVSDVKDAIPTKVSQLENDAGYITEGGGSFRNHVHQLIGDATIANMALSVAQKAVMKSYYTGKVIE